MVSILDTLKQGCGYGYGCFSRVGSGSTPPGSHPNLDISQCNLSIIFELFYIEKKGRNYVRSEPNPFFFEGRIRTLHPDPQPCLEAPRETRRGNQNKSAPGWSLKLFKALRSFLPFPIITCTVTFVVSTGPHTCIKSFRVIDLTNFLPSYAGSQKKNRALMVTEVTSFLFPLLLALSLS